jgi:hypothetical protein
MPCNRAAILAVAHQVAVALDHHIAKMDTDAKLHALFRHEIGIANRDCALHIDRATHGVHHAGELDEKAISGGVDDTPAMGRNRRIDQLVPERPQSRHRAFLVRLREPAIASNIGGENGRQPSGNLGHWDVTPASSFSAPFYRKSSPWRLIILSPMVWRIDVQQSVSGVDLMHGRAATHTPLPRWVRIDDAAR